MKPVLHIVSHSEEQTSGLAEKLATTCFVDGDILVLTGSLGAGKTVFVRGLAGGLGLDRELVNSPSFTLVNEYPGKRSLFHCDLYRLGDISELHELGWEDYLSKDGIVAIEWGEKARAMLPERYYQLDFRILNEQDREIEISYVCP